MLWQPDRVYLLFSGTHPVDDEDAGAFAFDSQHESLEEAKDAVRGRETDLDWAHVALLEDCELRVVSVWELGKRAAHWRDTGL